MKTVKLMFAIMLMGLFAQKTMATGQLTGLYLSAEDYANHKLSYATNGRDGNNISLNEFLASGRISVRYNGKRETILKSSIFGYRSGEQDYRYFDNTAYRIVDTKDFFIYCAPKMQHEGKWSKPVDCYYFSSTATGHIEALSIKNLERAFADNAKFRYMVESSFATDNALATYDAAVKEYKVKYLYEQAR